MGQSSKRVWYTDGSCRYNGKSYAVGSYACVEVQGDKIIKQVVEAFPPEPPVPTNIRMELMGVITALHNCSDGDHVEIHTDSAYVVNGMNQKWYKNWAVTGKNSQGKTPANLDLWRSLVRATKRMAKVDFIHVKGHNGDTFNEVCDRLAGEAVNDLEQELLEEELKKDLKAEKEGRMPCDDDTDNPGI